MKKSRVSGKARLGEISAQNVMYCLFVLTIHLLTPALLQHTGVFLFQRLLFCAIFGFIFLAGVKSTLGEKGKSVAGYYLGRLTHVALPYFLAVAIYMLVYGTVDGMPSCGITLRAFLSYALTGRLTPHFYFVIALFGLYLLTPPIKLLARKVGYPVLLGFSLAATVATAVFLSQQPFYNRLPTRYLFCYMLGCCAGANYSRFVSLLRRCRAVITAIFVPAAALELLFALLLRRAALDPTLCQVITMLYMPIAVCFVASLFSQASKLHISGVAAFVDGESYFIYLYHILALSFADIILAKLPPLGSVAFFIARCALCLAVLSVMLAMKLCIAGLAQALRHPSSRKAGK